MSTPDWFLKWRLRRAERALVQSRLRREVREIQDSNYGGLYIDQVEEERRIESRIAALRKQLALRRGLMTPDLQEGVNDAG